MLERVRAGDRALHDARRAHLALPFKTSVLGVEVKVVGVDITEDDCIVAICVRGGERQRIAILDLPLPVPAPAGVEWIQAYRHWLSPA